jgi:hypothetical protein
MILTEEQNLEFDKIARLMMKWLNDNCNPHADVIITPTNARLLAGVHTTGDIFDYVRD